MTREEALKKAKEIVCKSRQAEYGEPENNFLDIAKLWSIYKAVPFTETDIAVMMALMKIARIKNGEFKEDSFIDLIGYAACAVEIAGRREKQ